MADKQESDLKRLLAKGNQRFATMHPKHPHESKKRMLEIAKDQHPFAAVVCCSDSRVPPEVVFDQGLGDLFVVRTAGNLMGGLEVGSVEYAVEHLGVKLIIVMGHEGCGAIKAFVEGGEAHGHIRDIVDSIRAESEIRAINTEEKNLLQDCIRANIRHGIRKLKSQSAIIDEKVKSGKVEITGALYNLQKGLVYWIKE